MKKFKESYKKLNEKADKLPSWKFFTCCYILSFTLMFILYYALFHYAASDSSKLTYDVALRLSLGLSIFLSFIISILFTTNRNSTLSSIKFWKKAEQVDELLKNVKTKLDVEALYPVYNEMVDLSIGGAHYTEIQRLKAIIETKHELLP